jgi:D-tyrosyl-tRNA(Tyr) deacylase
MKALIQRVSEARVDILGKTLSSIDKGMLVFVGVEKGDTDRDIEWLTNKISTLRIFGDARKKMNLSVLDISGEALVVSQFTLSADCRRGNRPSFDRAEDPDAARNLYEEFIDRLKVKSVKVTTGEFGADMQVRLVNDGPVTIMLDSKVKS